nr:integrase, catalytic region, zinc finger, CCHC-type, peptidase aspartic, catalytic [Tanacetum cinerariifolium]
LFDANEDEYFNPGDDVELLLHRDPSMSVASILEGLTRCWRWIRCDDDGGVVDGVPSAVMAATVVEAMLFGVAAMGCGRDGDVVAAVPWGVGGHGGGGCVVSGVDVVVVPTVPWWWSGGCGGFMVRGGVGWLMRVAELGCFDGGVGGGVVVIAVGMVTAAAVAGGVIDGVTSAVMAVTVVEVMLYGVAAMGFGGDGDVVAVVVIQIVLWYIDSGRSKHMTEDCLRLRNFMKKFIRTVRFEKVRFENDYFGAIMGYGEYVISDSVISREAFLLCLRYEWC